MAIPPLDFLGYSPAKPAKAAKEDPSFSRISSFSRGVGQDSRSSPPVDRPIRDDHAAMLLTLDEDRRRAWWRSAARLVCSNGGDWLAAEDLATQKMRALCGADSWPSEPGRDDDRPAAEPPSRPGELPLEPRQWPPAERYAVAELERGGMGRDEAARHVREHGIPPELRGRVGATERRER